MSDLALRYSKPAARRGLERFAKVQRELNEPDTTRTTLAPTLNDAPNRPPSQVDAATCEPLRSAAGDSGGRLRWSVDERREKRV